MDEIKSTREAGFELRDLDSGVAGDTIFMARCYPLLLTKLDKLVATMESLEKTIRSLRELEKSVPDISQVERTNDLLEEIRDALEPEFSTPE